MYSSYSVADIGRAPNVQRGQRSLHGSQSHSNLLFGSSTNPNFSESMGSGPVMQSPNQQQQQYMAGYLLAASQGQVREAYIPELALTNHQAPPTQAREFTLTPLESERTLKRGGLGYSKTFGEESLLSAPRYDMLSRAVETR
jgi:hypothetical protein